MPLAEQRAQGHRGDKTKPSYPPLCLPLPCHFRDRTRLPQGATAGSREEAASVLTHSCSCRQETPSLSHLWPRVWLRGEAEPLGHLKSHAKTPAFHARTARSPDQKAASGPLRPNFLCVQKSLCLLLGPPSSSGHLDGPGALSPQAPPSQARGLFWAGLLREGPLPPGGIVPTEDPPSSLGSQLPPRTAEERPVEHITSCTRNSSLSPQTLLLAGSPHGRR